ncbi:hypothetical protein L2E82_44422 [Cichorium intybus]|uniref:Uncharacterized protein n=1 Tax=Cichorium intybus TaxID=13427 RepID=A0ACB8ZQC2_CICIN|nr:hypothetical protein L2E82_44422 [Cichorium intybus]
MAAEAPSQTEEMSIPVLKSKSANLVLRSDPKLYPHPFVALVECLKVYILGLALTHAPTIPAALVHKAHYISNALFDTNNYVKSVTYEVVDSRGKTKRVQLTKEKFAEALHLPLCNSKEMVIPIAEQLVDMFNAMDTNHSWRQSVPSKRNNFRIYRGISLAFFFDAYLGGLLVWTLQLCSLKYPWNVMKSTRIATLLCCPILFEKSSQLHQQKPLLKPKEKRKLTGGPTGPKRVTKKRKPSQQTTTKQKQSKRGKKVSVVDESLDSERTRSANIKAEEEEEEEEEEEHPTSPIPETRPPNPTTSPLTTTITSEQTTTIHTITSDVPPTTAPQTSTIYTTESPLTSSTQTTTPISSIIENPIISAAQTSEPIITTSEPLTNISSSEVDKSLPDFPFGDDFDFETTTFSKPPSTAEAVAAFHMAPLVIEEDEDNSLYDSDFILGKQYKILNRKLDALLQSNIGFDPTRGTEANLEDQMAEVQKVLTDKMEKLVKDSEKRILDQQIDIKRILEAKFTTAVEQIDERQRLLKEQTEKSFKDLVEKMEPSNSKVVKALSTLNENTSFFNSQYQTNFAKHLSDAHKRIEELTAANSRSAITIFANKLKKTNAALTSDIIEKLKRTLQPMINVSLKMERSQAGRQHPPEIAQADPLSQPSQGGESAASGSAAPKSQALVTQALVTQALVTAPLTTQAQGTVTTTSILGRPPFIPTISTAGPTFGTTTTTEAGGSRSRPQDKITRRCS